MATAQAKKVPTAAQKQAAAEPGVYVVLSPIRLGAAPKDVLYAVDDEVELTLEQAQALPPGHVRARLKTKQASKQAADGS